MIDVDKGLARQFIDFFKTFKDPLLPKETSLSRCQNIRRDLNVLEEKMNGTMLELGGSEFFVKTSSRSPKDATELFAERLNQIFLSLKDKNNYVEIQNVDPEVSLKNHIASLVLLSNIEILKVSNAQTALDLLLHSNRIYEDMHESIEISKKYQESIVIRKWVPINPLLEIRGFIYENQLTALSQYAHLVYVPILFLKKEEIKMRVREFWERECRDRLSEKFRSYIIDFCVQVNEENDIVNIIVIEINPFHVTTDACKFTWKNDENILKNGPFEFRVTESPDVMLLKKVEDRYPSLFMLYNE